MPELRDAVVQVRHREVRLPAQPVIDRQPGDYAKRIAAIEAVVLISFEFDLTVALSEIRHAPGHIIGDVETGPASVELERPGA